MAEVTITMGSSAPAKVSVDGAEVTVSLDGGVSIELGTPTTIIAENVSIADAGNYYTSTNVEGALQEVGADLATALAPTASNVSISDAGGYFDSNNVEGALQEIGADLGNLSGFTQDCIVVGDANGNLVSVTSVFYDQNTSFFNADNLIIEGDTITNTLESDEYVTSKQFRSTIQTLSIASGLIAWNMALGQRAKVTLTQSATLSNPTNATAAFPDLEVIQGGSGGYTLSFDTNFVLPDGYTAAGTALGSVTLYHFQLRSDGKIAVVYTYYTS